MIGLMKRGPASAACPSMAADQSNHSSSSVKMSSRMFESTSVPATSAAHQLHDLIRGQRSRPSAAHVVDDLAPAGARARLRSLGNTHAIPVERELDFRIREESQLVADFHRNRYLTFAGDAHGNTPTSKSNTIVVAPRNPAAVRAMERGRGPAVGWPVPRTDITLTAPVKSGAKSGRYRLLLSARALIFCGPPCSSPC